ncbi:MAG: bifunctional metallophosphatase/5'-nucleotidase [Bacilli bacterium]|jgi:2',3'-cyclic-nucleotide 2'-phosphodiesterase (5'-nucleotidase family)
MIKKRNASLTLLGIFSLMLSGCGKRVTFPSYTPYKDSDYEILEDEEGYKYVDFYALNDFHGAVSQNLEKSEPGIGVLANYMQNRRKENPGGSVFLANGDMWQGTIDSNLTRGKLVTDELNYLGFDAFTMGNHEFDWTTEQVKENKQNSKFPYLGANIIDKETGSRVDWLEASTFITRDEINIGIIGTIGADLERTVQASLISDIEFDVVTNYVKEEAEQLREKGADIVVLSTHDTLTTPNADYSEIISNHYVDAIFCGHEHALDFYEDNGIPILQTSGRGREVQYVRFAYKDGAVTLDDYRIDSVIEPYRPDLTEDEVAKQIYEYHAQDITKMKSKVVGKVKNGPLSITQTANLAVKAMVEAVPGSVGAIHNIRGGVRRELPNGKVKYEHIYEAFPFDNEIVIMKLTGNQLKTLMQSSSQHARYFNLTVDDIVMDEIYDVLTITYIYELDFEQIYKDYEITNVYAREAVVQYFNNHKTVDGKDF